MTVAPLLIALTVVTGAKTQHMPDAPVQNPFAGKDFEAHVGKGHWTGSTSGGIFLTGIGNTGGPIFSANGSAGVGYFVTDQVLLGGNVLLALNGGTGVTFTLGLNAYGDYWVPVGEKLFAWAGLQLGFSNVFGSAAGASFNFGPHFGLSAFLLPWLAIEPGLTFNLNVAPAVSFDMMATWGLRFFF